MKRYGAVIVFKPGVTRERAEAALAGMEMVSLIDGDYYLDGKPSVERFDDRYGGPVWYIP